MPTAQASLKSICLDKRWLSKTDLHAYRYFDDALLWDTLVDQGVLSPKECASVFNFIYKDHTSLFIDHAFLAQFSYSQLRMGGFFPLYESETHVGLLSSNPFNPSLQQHLSGKELSLYITSSHTLETLWTIYFPSHEADDVHILLTQAMHQQASDIHIHQLQNHVTITFRVQGQLKPITSLHTPIAIETLYRLIKLKAGMITAQRPTPQDGRFNEILNNETVDIRVSSIPTAFGEDLVLRLCHTSAPLRTLAECGFSYAKQNLIRNMLKETSGLICVTGPTGSGKTTTLYSLVQTLLEENRGQIITIEDPIERIIPSIRQSQINGSANYTYTEAIKATLRQDPDIIVIGEIRDKDTAKYVLDAAYTGHLVLTSVHTPDVSSTLLRLLNFDLDPHLISHCLKGIISQRLVSSPCNCDTGCPQCHFTGKGPQILRSECFLPKAHQLSIDTVTNFIEKGSILNFDHEL